MIWHAGEEKGKWSGELEQEAYRIARGIRRNVGIVWRRGYEIVYLPCDNVEGLVSPSGEITKIERISS